MLLLLWKTQDPTLLGHSEYIQERYIHVILEDPISGWQDSGSFNLLALASSLPLGTDISS